MDDGSSVRALIEEALESGRPAADVCRERPELAAAVEAGLRRARALDAELAALFPSSGDGGAPRQAPARGNLPAVPGYDVHGVLGHGGMGIVYRATHRQLGRPVALKMLLAGGYAAPAEIGRFLREAEAVARLRHPNIVQVYDVGEHDGWPYFTMELVEGGTLASELAQRPRTPREAAALLVTLAEAVDAAHRSGIVHRDLKPANVLVGADGALKITDFGLARRIDADPSFTATGARLGTPSYMAPEQALGRSRAIGPAVDVYALGALLYEMLTGRPPFRGETAADTERQVIEDEPTAPSRLHPKVPRDLETIALKCLRKEPAQRYATARELAGDALHFLRGEPISARPLGRVQRGVRWVRRNPTHAGLVAAVAALVVLGAGAGAREWAFATSRRAEEAKWEERLAFVHGLQEDGRFAEARAILARIPDAGSGELRRRIERAQGELDVLERLDAIRLERGFSRAGDRFDAAADAAYEQAFASAGLGTIGAPPADVAERIVATGVRAALVAALDDWALCVRDRARLEWIFDVARRADPDPWRDRVRDPSQWEDPSALAALAAEAPAGESVPLLLVVCGLLDGHGGDGTALLRRVQQSRPDDFWINFSLASALAPHEDSIGFYRAALAVRPRALAAQVDLANALAAGGRDAEALECWRVALEMAPDAASVHESLAAFHLGRRALDAAVEHASAAVRLDATRSAGHRFLGLALLQSGDYAGGAAALRAALALVGRDDPVRAELADGARYGDEMTALAERLDGVASDADEPAGDLESAQLAVLASQRQRYALAARLYERALEGSFATGDLHTSLRYPAASAAALAGGESDVDAAGVSAAERERWRGRALAWMRADLEAWSRALAADDPELLPYVVPRLEQWRADPELDALREGADALAFWRDVDALLARARGE